MKRNPIVNAIKFNGYQSEETKDIGLQPLPAHMQIQCKCGYKSENHLMFKDHLICPNNYVIFEGNEVTGVMSIKQFESIYGALIYQDAKFIEVTEEKR